MSLILVFSILLRVAAFCWSIILFRRMRDWRILFLTLFILSMLARPVFKLIKGGVSSTILLTTDWTELVGGAGSAMVFVVVYFLVQYVTGHQRAEKILAQSEEQSRKLSEELRALGARLQSIREEQSIRIARQIHDELGQTLTALKMNAAWLERNLSKDRGSLLERIRSLVEISDSGIQTVRKIASELRPGVLHELGLVAAIEWQAKEFGDRTGIHCEFISSDETIPSSPDQATAAFRILQEALTNVWRHADANKVEICLNAENSNLILEVRDDGKGISESEISSSKSLGLLGIRERAHILGGKVDIGRMMEKGTELTVSIPLREQK